MIEKEKKGTLSILRKLIYHGYLGKITPVKLIHIWPCFILLFSPDLILNTSKVLMTPRNSK